MNLAPPSELSLIETRILGCLCEKEVTTPDHYPLSLNSLTNACNQKSNRQPILALDEEEVAAGLESLRLKKLIMILSMAGSHVAKYKHCFENYWNVTKSQRAIMTELLNRGPQTPGELRMRCERMSPNLSLDQVREALETLSEGNFPLVRILPKQPGKKDHRWTHLLSGEPEDLSAEAISNEPVKVKVAMSLPPEVEERLASLEKTAGEQSATIAALQEELAVFKSQFE